MGKLVHIMYKAKYENGHGEFWYLWPAISPYDAEKTARAVAEANDIKLLAVCKAREVNYGK